MVLFLALGTQWLWAGLGERVGLNYAMIEPTARMLDLDLEPRTRLMIDLKVMEDEALKAWAEKRSAGAGR